MKCIVEMFSNNEKSSTYLSKICEDLMLVGFVEWLGLV